jgi:diguanylate cyclase (GGDEF)-like protein
MKQFFTHKIGYAIATLICISAILFFLHRLKGLQNTQKELDKTYAIFEKTNAMVYSLNAAQAYSKDYIITRDNLFLQLYADNVNEGLQTINTLLSELHEIHHEQLLELENLFEEKKILLLRLSNTTEFPYFADVLMKQAEIPVPDIKSSHTESQLETDTAFIRDNRRFLQRLFSRGQGASQIITIRQSDSEVSDYNAAQYASSPTATATAAATRQDVEKKQQFQQQLRTLEMKYLELYSTDQRIGQSISTILIQLQKDAQRRLMEMLLEKDYAIRKILLSGILSFFAIFGAVFMIFQSAKKIAEAKRISEELMQARQNVLIDKVYECPLTGIHNRRFFDEKANEVMKSLAITNGRLSLLMIDIDHFKNYNDGYGHQMGDECLKTVAQILSKSIGRADDFVARYGGEEFVIVLPSTDSEDACLLAEEIIRTIHKANIPHQYSSVANHVTLSIGVAGGTVNPSLTTDDFIKVADDMLYSSKEAGRNRYTFSEMENTILKTRKSNR